MKVGIMKTNDELVFHHQELFHQFRMQNVFPQNADLCHLNQSLKKQFHSKTLRYSKLHLSENILFDGSDIGDDDSDQEVDHCDGAEKDEAEEKDDSETFTDLIIVEIICNCI